MKEDTHHLMPSVGTTHRYPMGLIYCLYSSFHNCLSRYDSHLATVSSGARMSQARDTPQVKSSRLEAVIQGR